MHNALQLTLQAAALARQNGQWAEALGLYREAEAALPPQAALLQNLALCAFHLGHYGEAATQSKAAYALDGGLWQAALLHVKALRRQGAVAAAQAWLEHQLLTSPARKAFAAEYADLLLNDLGDAVRARQLLEPLATDPIYGEDAALTAITTRLYDRGDESEDALVARVCTFAQQYIEPYALPGLTPRGPRTRVRPRIGLISPFFARTPVYYLAYGALAELARHADLHFFHRGTSNGPETAQFRALSAGWQDCASWGPEKLARALAALDLDALVDMGGWSDVNALRALTSKPARKMAKWVGGQSVTTGLACFDGWLSDTGQALPEQARYYTEPLVNLASGYVTYTPPARLPAPVPDTHSVPVLGIAANPAKVSQAFLRHVQEIAGQGPVQFQFIDRRYRQPAARRRILAALGPAVVCSFVVPEDHHAYLRAIGQVSAILDTFPYTSGLTAIEALALGVPVLTRPGVLFCERHAYAHRLACGQAPDYAAELAAVLRGPRGGPRHALLAGTPRQAHEALAAELLRVLG